MTSQSLDLRYSVIVQCGYFATARIATAGASDNDNDDVPELGN